MENKESVIIMNFSGIYREEKFWKEQEISWVEARDISGTNCYCDDEAVREIKKRIKDFPVAGIHFIDSGNYHYMTRLWLERIQTPFRLLVFDNHTDMQLPAFGDLLSCGGWIASSLEKLENLKQVILVGPDNESYSQVEKEFKRKVIFLSREIMGEMDEKSTVRKLGDILAENDLPLYISIDKDVLAAEFAQTTWSQGDMTLQTLLECVKFTMKCAEQKLFEITGVDICGEADAENIHDNTANDYANQELIKIFTDRKGVD